MKKFEFINSGNKILARELYTSDNFYVGSKVSWKDNGKTNYGLQNLTGIDSEKYRPEDFVSKYGIWAHFIYPTVICEGGLFHALNTYDSASFTFGFLQFAAHVPDGDFVLYLREILRLKEASDYFPDLKLINDRVNILENGGFTQLETSLTTEKLQRYLNPNKNLVDKKEIDNSTRFVHWVKNSELHRNIQVQIGIDLFKKKMVDYAKRYNLNGQSISICCVVADIRHQGRAKSENIIASLNSKDPLNSLLELGGKNYSSRNSKLRLVLKQLMNQGVFANKRYDLLKRDFV